jgi:hypothetical protein
LLRHLGITTTPKYWIKGVPHPGLVEFRAIVEIFQRSKVVSRHTGLVYRASDSDAAWQAMSSWSHCHHSKVKNSVHHLLPHWKKDKFTASRVKNDVPRMEMVHHQDIPMMEMVHHQDVTAELSTHLLAAQ